MVSSNKKKMISHLEDFAVSADHFLVQSTGAAEDTNCISAEG